MWRARQVVERERQRVWMKSRLADLVHNEEGQDLLEYALLVALIVLVAVGAMPLAGQSVATIFGRIATALQNAA